jgi:uncharacterized protein (TIGR00645 family)
MSKIKKTLTQFIFMGRWLQLPLYFGLILILGVYAYRFLLELFVLTGHATSLDNTGFMLVVLDLIDVVMIANLLIMVIIGGYETFVSPLHLHDHSDRPEWLDEVNAGTMKVKLALSLIGISSIHLLRTFIDPAKLSNMNVMWQVVIHITLVLSALAIAFTNFIMEKEKIP